MGSRQLLLIVLSSTLILQQYCAFADTSLTTDTSVLGNPDRPPAVEDAEDDVEHVRLDDIVTCPCTRPHSESPACPFSTPFEGPSHGPTARTLLSLLHRFLI